MTRRALRKEEGELLSGLVWRRAPELIGAMRQLGKEGLSDEKRELVRGLVSDELTEKGLGANGEPTDLGKRLDDLIGLLGEL